MNLKTFNLKKLMLSAALIVGMSVVPTSCSDDDPEPTYEVNVVDKMPEELPANYTVQAGQIVFTELNTGISTTFDLTSQQTKMLHAGTYDVTGNMTVEYTQDGQNRQSVLRAVASQQVISELSRSVTMNWFFYNPENTLVFGEIYFAGSPNAAGTNGLFDTYFTIYNNTDEVQYADGLAIVESKLVNTSTDQILTEANFIENNFTGQTVYVIPGNGTDVPIQPGKSIKIVDQAIDWSAQVPGALNHTDADFEWYDETTKNTDTDNPAVPNLDKWFSYSATIWVVSNQCNRSYALVRFPEGMNAEKLLAEYDGTYKYINAATGKEMPGTKCLLIKYDWIIDGVNLCPDEGFTQGALRGSIDAGHAAISDKKTDKERFGKKFVRKVSGKSATGNDILMDTNDSSVDFELKSAK